jgi:hypothetical protein
VGVTLGYRRSRADFHPADIVVTHTQPASATRTFTTDRETTWARVIDSGVRATGRLVSSEAWRLDVEAALMPLTRARLDISLPDKYPGQRLSFEAMAWSGFGRATIERRWGRLSGGLSVWVSGARGYRESARYGQRAGGAALSIGLR